LWASPRDPRVQTQQDGKLSRPLAVGQQLRP
jgi:hypothetical protein